MTAEPIFKPSSMTFEQAAQLDPDRDAGDIVQGEWAHVSKNTWRHSLIVGNAYALLRAYARQQGGWFAGVGDPGTKLSTNPDTLRGPDVGVIRAERFPTGKGAAGWLDGAPDLAVEVAGDGQSGIQLARKGLEYLAAGGRMVWVIDPDAELVVVLTAPDHLRVFGKDDTLDAGDVLPGFTCAVVELFE